MRDEPVYRGILAIDIERFSRAEWTDPVRKRLRGRLHRLVDDALTRAEIDPSLTARSDTGDGLWLLVGPEVSTARLLHPLATGLTSDAATSNQHAPGTEQMRRGQSPVRAWPRPGPAIPPRRGGHVPAAFR